MNLETVGVKLEPGRPLPQFCNACFNTDRTLSPVGQFIDVLYSLLDNKGTNLLFDQEVWLCWECHAVLRRVAEFRTQVTTVQNFLYNYHCGQNIPLPNSLTKLAIWHANNEIYIEYGTEYKHDSPETLQDTKIKKEIHNPSEPSLDETEIELKGEIEEIDTRNDSDWHYEELNEMATTEIKPINWRKFQKRPKPPDYKYIRRAEKNLCLEKFFTKYKVNQQELEDLFEKDRNDKLFLEYPHRCEICIWSWKDRNSLVLHNKTRHSKRAGSLQCDICTKELMGKKRLKAHVKAHYLARQCNVCGYKTTTSIGMRRHILKNHYKSVECKTCGACFRSTREFFKHYKELHQKFICDHCGRACRSRRSIKKHLTLHGPFICCGQNFKNVRTFRDHRMLKHKKKDPPEQCYCVECDIQFRTIFEFNQHLRSSVAHGRKKIRRNGTFPCPVCGKVYTRKTYMRYHHDFVHLNRSDYKCDQCDLLFLNRTHLVRHKRSKHMPYWKAPKDKICNVCGRGFAEKVVLTKHMRTHTGERPYHCTLCDAKFAQSTALKTHIKHIHLKEARKPTGQVSAKASQRASYLRQSTGMGGQHLANNHDTDRESSD